MRERCDCCGNEVPLLEIVFTGRQYLCPQCECLKNPALMGLSITPQATRNSELTGAVFA
jgi:hypothetical protein